MKKTHFLRSYKVGLFENDITACGVVGRESSGVLHQHRTGARFELSEKPTCVWCNRNM